MATLIQLKRSLNTSIPVSLANGEPAYTANGDVLYIGSNGEIVPIGGKRFPGVLTANQALVANSTSYLDVIKTANLYIGSATVNAINAISNATHLGAASNSEILTSWAVKTYVDYVALNNGKAAGNGMTSNATSYAVAAGTDGGLVSNATGVFIQSGNGVITDSNGLRVVAGTGVTVNATGVHIGQAVGTSSSVTFNDITVSGNLVINGSLTNINATSLAVTDALILMANGNGTTDSLDIGFYGMYGNSTVTQYTGLFRDSSNDAIWTLFNSETSPTTTVDTGAGSYSIGTLFAQVKSFGLISNTSAVAITANSTLAVTITANSMTLSTALGVASGGTGAATFTTNGILYGNGTGAIQATAAGADGKVLVSSSGTPTWSDMDGGAF